MNGTSDRQRVGYNRFVEIIIIAQRLQLKAFSNGVLGWEGGKIVAVAGRTDNRHARNLGEVGSKCNTNVHRVLNGV